MILSIFQIILLILFNIIYSFLHHPPRKDHEWERKHNGFTWDDFWTVMDHNQRVKAMMPMRSKFKKLCEKFPNGVSTTSSGIVMINLVCLRFWSTYILLSIPVFLYFCLFVLFQRKKSGQETGYGTKIDEEAPEISNSVEKATSNPTKDDEMMMIVEDNENKNNALENSFLDDVKLVN